MPALAILVIAGSAVAFGLWLDAWLSRRKATAKASLFNDATSGAVFLFDGEILVDCSPAGRAILAADAAQTGPWVRLMAFLAPMFDGLEEKFRSLGEHGRLSQTSAGERKVLLTAEIQGGLTRISLFDSGQEDEMPEPDPITWQAQGEELDQLRNVVADAPMLIWRERPDGAVTWANAAYVLALAERLEPGSDFSWPLARLFEDPPAPGETPQKRALDFAEGGQRWYELQSKEQGTHRLVYALPADRLEQAERSLREILVTLTKTFAHLHVGLAIFDHDRHLHLFNPAITDLTGLPVDFLARRPSLTAVLDAMRERNTIPEPKDYRSWRLQMLDMEKAAASGLYQETWSLPSGQTYRVIGRPYPDGALALIIEDISDEMTRSRRYRAEIELGHAVLDGLDEAVAVFSQSGQLVMSNAAYSRLWGHDPASALGEETLASLLGQWKELSAPSSAWAEFEEMAAATTDRQMIRTDLRLKDGRLIACRFSPLEGGATMAIFTLMTTKPGIQPAAGQERLRA